MNRPPSPFARLRRAIAAAVVATVAVTGSFAAAPAFAEDTTPVIGTPVAESPAVESTEAADAPTPAADAPADEAPAELAQQPAAAPLAAAASVSAPMVTVTQASRIGGTVTVTGSGFAATTTGIYLGLGPVGIPGFYLGAGQLVSTETTWIALGNGVDNTPGARTVPMAADGSFTVDITVPAVNSTTPAYALYTSKAHGQGIGDTTQNTTTPVEYRAAPSVTVSKTSDLNPAGDTVVVRGSGFVADGTATNGLYPPLAGSFGGVYVAFGRFADVWKPTEGAASSTRVNAGAKSNGLKWVLPAASVAAVGGASAGAVELNADGTFEVTLMVAKNFTNVPAAGNYGIYTYIGSGAKYAPFETATPISFSGPRVTVSKTNDLDPAGDTVTVHGEGFLPDGTATNATRPPLTGTFSGVYVGFGRYADAWKPSAGAASSARSNGSVNWAVPAASMATIGGAAAGAIELRADGTFEATLTVSKDYAKVPASGNYGVYTYAGGGVVYAPFETATPVSFSGPSTTGLTVSAATVTIGSSVTATATVSPSTAAGTVGFFDGAVSVGSATVVGGVATAQIEFSSVGSHSVRAVFTPTSGALASESVSVPVEVTPATVGALSWGVSSGFRSYITGPIAAGTVTVSAGATASGGSYRFGQSGGSFDHTTLAGDARYSGTVRFVGHGGILDLAFSDPILRVTNPSRGVLSLSVNGSRVDLATVDLSAASRSASGGATTFAGAPVTLTAAGSAAFQGYYSTGAVLEPLTATIGAVGAAPAGSTGTVGAASQRATTATIPSTPPATTGIELDAAALQALVSGGEFTFTAAGFQPNEGGIMVVVYSTPTVLARGLTADAAGVVTWTGSLPASLETGQHTLTVQGSVSKGLVFTMPERTTTAGACTVAAATLDWGFKESFRAYLTSGIANGTWNLDQVTDTHGIFGWTNGAGALDADTARGVIGFTGSIRFTGHDGALDTTIANPRIEINGDSAVLIVDVTGTTQTGEPIAASGVRFADIDLGGSVLQQTDAAIVAAAASATLTADGSAAFGTYPEGEGLDAVSFTLPLASGCASPAMAEPLAASGGEASAASETLAADEPLDLTWLWIVIGIVLLLVIAAVVVIARRRKPATDQG